MTSGDDLDKDIHDEDLFAGQEPPSRDDILRYLYREMRRLSRQIESDRRNREKETAKIWQEIMELQMFKRTLRGMFIGWGAILGPLIAALATYIVTN